MKKTRIMGAFIALSAVALAGCGSAESTNVSATAASEVTTATQQVPEKATQKQFESTKAVDYSAYDELIKKIANGLNTKFTDDDYANLDVSFAIKANYSDYETYGYIKKDLDGDGIDELLLGSTIKESGETVIYDIFTIKDSKLKHVVSGSERARYYLCKDGTVAMEGSGGAAYSNWTYYEYKNGELKVKETVFTDDSIPGQTYYYSKDSEPVAASSDAISEADAKKIINKYTYEKVQYNAFK